MIHTRFSLSAKVTCRGSGSGGGDGDDDGGGACDCPFVESPAAGATEVELLWERLAQQTDIVELGEGDAEGGLVERDSELLLGEAPELGEGAVPVTEVPDGVADVVEVVDLVDLLVVDENFRTE